MRSLSARPRVAALIVAFIGFVFSAVNHRTVLNERNYYPMLMLFGPVCMLIGIAAAIEPRILNPSGIQAGRGVAVFRALTLLIVLIGMGIGWAMAHFWYRIPGW